MLTGEFIRSDGLVIRNNITKIGAAQILSAAFRDDAPEFWLGLVQGTPDPDLQIEDLIEPTLGVNGYQRYEIARSALGWPNVGEVNGERYIESDWVTWTATGNFSQPIQRLALFMDDTATTGDVFALSAPLPALLTIGAATPLIDRKYKYRIYLR